MSSLSERISALPPEKRALMVRLLREHNTRDDAPALTRRPRTQNKFPLSYAQQRLWSIHQLDPDSALYNIPAGVRIRGALDVPALEQSLNEVIRRHEILRTTFTNNDDEAVQIVTPYAPTELPVRDQRSLDIEERERATRETIDAIARQPFDLEHGPLLRSEVLRVADDEFLHLVTVHHIVFDGWSAGVFFEELWRAYRAFSRGQPSPLPDLPIQYADYAVWEQEWLQRDVLRNDVGYWKQQLDGAPDTLDLARERPKTQTYEGARETFALPAALTNDVKALSREEGATVFMTLMAAFRTVLYRYTGQHEINVGTLVANRERNEIKPLIGFFANTLVLRGSLSDDMRFRELLRQERETILTAYEHQRAPFDKVLAELQLERDPSRTPLFQVVFVFQNAPMPTVELEDVTLEFMQIDNGVAKFDLVLNMWDTDGGLIGAMVYNTNLFEAELIQRLLDHFRRVLEAVTDDADLPLIDIPLSDGAVHTGVAETLAADAAADFKF